MPSPFPGMDPFIEGQVWRDFHIRFIAATAEVLTPVLLPRYLVLAEETVYVEHQSSNGDAARVISPDVFVAEACGGSGGGAAAAVAAEPAILTLPMPVEYREAYLTIRRPDSMELVTAIEVLSPNNKRQGSVGQRKYPRKRDVVAESRTNLVELDLVRAGQRLPMVEPLPPGDYYAIVSREESRPKAEVYHWTLRDALPAVPVPLAAGDTDASLDLQQVFTTVYDRARYDFVLRYDLPVQPSLAETDAAWAQQVLAGRPAGA